MLFCDLENLRNHISTCKLFNQSIDLSLFYPGDIDKFAEPR